MASGSLFPLHALVNGVYSQSGHPFIEPESFAGSVIAAVYDVQSRDLNDDRNAAPVLSPAFLGYVRPSFHRALADIIKRLASDLDDPRKSALRAFTWSMLFSIVGNSSVPGDAQFTPVVDSAIAKIVYNPLDVELLFVSFLLVSRLFPHYFGPNMPVDHLPSGIIGSQLIERSAQEFFAYLRRASTMVIEPAADSNAMQISQSDESSVHGGAGVPIGGQIKFTPTPPSTPTHQPSSPFSSFMIVPQSDGPMFQKFRRSEFKEMTFVVTSSGAIEKGSPKSKQEPKSLSDMMGSFRVDEWKDETPAQMSKPSNPSSLARSAKKRVARNTSDNNSTTGSNSSSPKHSPLTAAPFQFEFHLDINPQKATPSLPVSPKSPSEIPNSPVSAVSPTDMIGLSTHSSSPHDSPRSSQTYSTGGESPRQTIAFQGLPGSHHFAQFPPGLYHSAPSHMYRGVGLSQSEPLNSRMKKRKSAFREVSPGSFTKPLTMQSPEILSLGISDRFAGQRGRSHSARLSNSDIVRLDKTLPRSNSTGMTAGTVAEDEGECEMDIDPQS